MKIVIVGGHLSPALSVIDALPKDVEVLFVGRKYTFEGDRAISLEYNTIRSLKIPFASISTGRFQRKITRYTILTLLKIPYGFIQSLFILKNFKPDVALSFGGYLSVPVGLVAVFLRIPIVIHEQTLEAGVSNKIISNFANKVCISWETSKKYFPKDKTVLTGNPIRKFRIQNSEFRIINKDNLPVVYITGGSGGSHYINTLVEGCIKELLEKFIIIHQTGDAQEYRDFERLSNFKETLPSKLKARYYLLKFVDPQEIGAVLNRANLVIGRSGINTVTELIFFEKPGLLIPLPYSQNNEQIKNALFFRNQGLGEVLYQLKGLTSNKLFEVLIRMFDNIDRYKILKQVQDDKSGAADKIVEVVYNEVQIKKRQKR